MTAASFRTLDEDAEDDSISAGVYAALLAQGLRSLQAQGAFCDCVLIAQKARFRVHQIVLAAGRTPIRTHILDGISMSLTGGPAPPPKPLELTLRGMPSPAGDAVDQMLGDAYGGNSFEDAAMRIRELWCDGRLCDMRIAAGGGVFVAHQAVLGAASATLRDYIAEQSSELAGARQCETRGEARAVDKGLVPRALLLELNGITQADAVGTVLDHIYGGVGFTEEYEASSAIVNEEVLQLCTAFDLPILRSKAEQWKFQGDEEVAAKDIAFPALSTIKYNSLESVPRALSRVAAEARLSRQEAKTLQRIRQAFEERPVWLEHALASHLPGATDSKTLSKLIPFVAYQWADSPWMGALVRLGWDPREHPEESKGLQVIEFKDPFLAGVVVNAADKRKRTIDSDFTNPPVLPRQVYQLVDIKDVFVSDLIRDAAVSTECTKKAGWLDPFVVDAIHQRLVMRSEELRERFEAMPASLGGHRGACGRPPKRARISGA